MIDGRSSDGKRLLWLSVNPDEKMRRVMTAESAAGLSVRGMTRPAAPRFAGADGDSFHKTTREAEAASGVGAANAANASVHASTGTSALGDRGDGRVADSPAAKVAGRLRDLLRLDEKRKRNAVAFFAAMTGQPPLFHMIPQAESPAEAARLAEINQLAKNIRLMAPLDKVDVIRQTFGQASPPARVAEALLIHRRLPTARDTFHVVAPPEVTAASAGFQTAAFGVMMLASMVLPFVSLTQQGLLAQLASTAMQNTAVTRALATAALIP